MQEINTTTQDNEKYNAYFKAVMGSERARHTYQRRFSTIERLANGLDKKRILDIGCGYGFRTIGIAKKGVKSITGIDLDQERIYEANDYARKMSIHNVEFQVMNAESMEFKSESFNVVMADEMIHHAENLPAVIAEMYRVTRKDGVTIISDHNKWSLASEIIRFIYFGRNREKIYSARQVYGLLKRAHFRDIKYKHIIFTVPFARTPRPLLKVNYILESIIETTPFLRLQCGVYVIRGIK